MTREVSGTLKFNNDGSFNDFTLFLDKLNRLGINMNLRLIDFDDTTNDGALVFLTIRNTLLQERIGIIILAENSDYDISNFQDTLNDLGIETNNLLRSFN